MYVFFIGFIGYNWEGKLEPTISLRSKFDVRETKTTFGYVQRKSHFL